MRLLKGKALKRWLMHHPKVASFLAARGGRITALRVRRRKPRTLNAKALKLAASQIGYHEDPPGSNHTKYGVWYGVDHQPWCAIFVSWVLSHVGRPFKEAYVPTIVDLARAGQDGLSVIPYQNVSAELRSHPVLACYDWPGESPGLADHVEFVQRVVTGSTFIAVGGNTGGPGADQSNGGEVWRNTRYTVDVLCFVKVT